MQTEKIIESQDRFRFNVERKKGGDLFFFFFFHFYFPRVTRLASKVCLFHVYGKTKKILQLKRCFVSLERRNKFHVERVVAATAAVVDVISLHYITYVN